MSLAAFDEEVAEVLAAKRTTRDASCRYVDRRIYCTTGVPLTGMITTTVVSTGATVF